MIEVLIHQVTRRQCGNAKKFTHVRFAEQSHAQAHTTKSQQVAQAVDTNARYGFEPKWLKRVCKTLHQAEKLLIGLDVALANTRQRVFIQDDVISIRTQSDGW